MTSLPQTILQILIPFLDSDFIKALSSALRLARQVIGFRSHIGLYDVLEHEVTLDLQDAEGKKAVYSKRQKVRFLQNNIVAYQDQAWGDGDIFAEYKCSPGIPVDRYREGYRYYVLISLRETKNYGDVEEFHIERTVTDGFTKPTEEFQTQVNHIMHQLSMSVIFPKDRPSKHVILIEQNLMRTWVLGPEHTTTLPNGRQKVTWTTNKPRLFESYILRWEW